MMDDKKHTGFGMLVKSLTGKKKGGKKPFAKGKPMNGMMKKGASC